MIKNSTNGLFQSQSVPKYVVSQAPGYLGRGHPSLLPCLVSTFGISNMPLRLIPLSVWQVGMSLFGCEHVWISDCTGLACFWQLQGDNFMTNAEAIQVKANVHGLSHWICARLH